VTESGLDPATLPGVDPDVPSVARMYDYYLGGVHNFASDRAAARKVITALPATRSIAMANRAYLRRAVRFLIGAGVRQFLDIGSGTPTVGNVHEIAQRAVPSSRVAYVDLDPVAVIHARHLLRDNDRATMVEGNLLRVEPILAHPDVRRLLDFDQPVGLLLVSVLHFIPDADDPFAAVAAVLAALPSGSYVAISHGLRENFTNAAADIQKVYTSARSSAVPRPRAEIERFFAGTDLVEPGLVEMTSWRPDQSDDLVASPEGWESAGVGFLAGVGRKP
jgi:SAM-dependent methyltransferase